MRPFVTVVWAVAMLAAGLKVEGVVLEVPTPVITPGPSITGVEAMARRDDPDA